MIACMHALCTCAGDGKKQTYISSDWVFQALALSHFFGNTLSLIYKVSLIWPSMHGVMLFLRMKLDRERLRLSVNGMQPMDQYAGKKCIRAWMAIMSCNYVPHVAKISQLHGD